MMLCENEKAILQVDNGDMTFEELSDIIEKEFEIVLEPSPEVYHILNEDYEPHVKVSDVFTDPKYESIPGTPSFAMLTIEVGEGDNFRSIWLKFPRNYEE